MFGGSSKVEINQQFGLRAPAIEGSPRIITTVLGKGWAERPLEDAGWILTPFRAMEVLMLFEVLKNEPELAGFFTQEFSFWQEIQGRSLFSYWQEMGQRAAEADPGIPNFGAILEDRRKLGKLAKMAKSIHLFLKGQKNVRGVFEEEKRLNIWQVFDGKDIGYQHLILDRI